MMGFALPLVLLLVTEAPQALANPVECQASQYLDGHGQCTPCRACGPGMELSKECGYGEGGDSQCTPCRLRRFKDSWGHHGCKPCLSCALIHRIQTSPCTATSNTACGACFTGFYSKTQIGGLQDLECIPCSKQTPPSEPQCHSRVSQKEENSARPTPDTALVVLASSALVVAVLVSFLSLLYCQQFWKSQCQQVFLRRWDSSSQRVTFQGSAGPARLPHREQQSHPCCLGIKSVHPGHRALEGPLGAVQFFPEAEVLAPHLPNRQATLDLPRWTVASPKALQPRSSPETRALLRDSGGSNSSAGGSSFTELGQDPARDTDAPAPLSSCATERQPHWPHSPVECTELDLQNFSAQVERLRRGEGQKTDVRPGLTRCVEPAAQARLALASPHTSESSFRQPIAESGVQLPLPSISSSGVQTATATGGAKPAKPLAETGPSLCGSNHQRERGTTPWLKQESRPRIC